MQNTARRPKITVSADGTGLVSQAGGAAAGRAAAGRRAWARACPAALARWRAPRAVHDPGKIVADLAMALALGGDCLADVAVLRAQPELAGPVASDPVISRLIGTLAADAPRALRAIRAGPGRGPGAGLGAGRRRARPARTGALIPVDIDATIVLAHSPALATGC